MTVPEVLARAPVSESRKTEQVGEQKQAPHGDMVILRHEKAIHMARNRRMAIFTMVIPYVQKTKLDLSPAHCSYTHPDTQEWFLNPDLNASVGSDSWGVY